MPNDQRKKDLETLLTMGRERAQKYVQLCNFVEKNGADATVLDQLVIGSGDLAGVLAVIGQRAQDFAAEILDEADEA